MQSIILAPDEKGAWVTEFGPASACESALSEADIDRASPGYGTVRRLVTGLCGPHDVRFTESGTSAYVAEVEGQRLLRVDFLQVVFLLLLVAGR